MANVFFIFMFLLSFPFGSSLAGKDKVLVSKHCFFPYSVLYEQTGDSEWTQRIDIYAYDSATLASPKTSARILFGLEVIISDPSTLPEINTHAFQEKECKVIMAKKEVGSEEWLTYNYLMRIPYFSLSKLIELNKEGLQFTNAYGCLAIHGIEDVANLETRQVLGSYQTPAVHLEFVRRGKGPSVLMREMEVSLDHFLDRLVALCELERWSGQEFGQLSAGDRSEMFISTKAAMALTVKGQDFNILNFEKEKFLDLLPTETRQYLTTYLTNTKQSKPTTTDIDVFRRAFKTLLKIALEPYKVRFMSATKDGFTSYKMMVTQDVESLKGTMVGLDEKGSMKTHVLPLLNPNVTPSKYFNALCEMGFDLMPAS